jgi:hypothetical protein
VVQVLKISKPRAVSLAVAAMSIPQIQAISFTLSFDPSTTVGVRLGPRGHLAVALELKMHRQVTTLVGTEN